MKGGCQTLKSLLAGSRQDKTTQQPTYIAFHEKGRITQMVKPITQGGTALLSFQVLSYIPLHLGCSLWVCHCLICFPVSVKGLSYLVISHLYSPA